MKNNSFLTGIMVLTIVFVLSGCPNPADPTSEPSPFIGSWRVEGLDRIVTYSENIRILQVASSGYYLGRFTWIHEEPNLLILTQTHSTGDGTGVSTLAELLQNHATTPLVFEMEYEFVSNSILRSRTIRQGGVDVDLDWHNLIRQ